MITLPEGLTLAILKERYDTAETHYTKAMRKAKLLDATDRGRLWEATGVKFPKYQILTDSNHISYVKNNLLASVYSASKIPTLEMTSEEDKDIIMGANVALENAWNKNLVGFYQMQAGERAALLNLGVTHVGWNPKKEGGKGDYWYKGDIKLKNINPLKYRRDPFADTLDDAAFACYWDTFHKSVLLADEKYKDEFKAFEKTKQRASMSTTQDILGDVTGKENAGQKDYYKIFINWIKIDGTVIELHTINHEYVLYMVEELKPNDFPISELYCNLPAGDVMGTSEPSKVFANSLAHNLMGSITLTAEYKNQRPPRFISDQSGININAFKRYGNEADHTFIVRGDASKAVHYHQFPQASPQLPVMMAALTNDIKNLSGVDDRYTGRDTGSIITTGGTEAMLDQVTMIDQPKINNYNMYARKLSHLIMSNLIEFAPKRKYFIKDPKDPKQYLSVTVNFPDIDPETIFDYNIDISSELPKNKARVAQMATVLMEKQLQYRQSGLEVDWITPEEWLMFQDIPYKEYMTERMGIQRNSDYVKQVSQIIFQYAELTQQGMKPEEALLATANTMDMQRKPQQGQQLPNPEQVMPGVGQGVSPL